MKLLVIEGLDGAGKSTQIGLLADYLSKKGVKTEHIHFPRTETPYFGELIARFLRGEFGTADHVDPYLVAMLYAGDRNDAAQQIRKWLDSDHMVILDRYTYSNIAYQCAKTTDIKEREKLRNWILKLEFSHFKIPVPDLNIFLDVPFIFTKTKLTSSRQGKDRAYLNGFDDIHEADIDFQRRVREVYHETAGNDSRLTIINCSDKNDEMLPPHSIFGLVKELLIEKEIIS